MEGSHKTYVQHVISYLKKMIICTKQSNNDLSQPAKAIMWNDMTNLSTKRKQSIKQQAGVANLWLKCFIFNPIRLAEFYIRYTSLL